MMDNREIAYQIYYEIKTNLFKESVKDPFWLDLSLKYNTF